MALWPSNIDVPQGFGAGMAQGTKERDLRVGELKKRSMRA